MDMALVLVQEKVNLVDQALALVLDQALALALVLDQALALVLDQDLVLLVLILDQVIEIIIHKWQCV